MTEKERKTLEKAGLIYPTIVTNADKIRHLTDEELAEWLADILHCHGRLYANRYAYECPSECPLWNCCKEPPGSISDWLKEEANT